MVGSAVLKIIWSSDASSMATISPANTSRMLRLFSVATRGGLAGETVSESVIRVFLPSLSRARSLVAQVRHLQQHRIAPLPGSPHASRQHTGRESDPRRTPVQQLAVPRTEVPVQADPRLPG